jgi:hypothetical protein
VKCELSTPFGWKKHQLAINLNMGFSPAMADLDKEDDMDLVMKSKRICFVSRRFGWDTGRRKRPSS